MAAASPTWVVLAGGRAERMGSPKAELDLAGRRLIDHVIDAIPQADPVIVVGPGIELGRPVRFALEEPRFGGPVAALAAALPMVASERFVLLAVDMPDAVPLAQRLIDEPGTSSADAVLAVTPDGRRQPLCTVWRTDAARTALAAIGGADGAAMHALLDRARVAEVRLDGPAAEGVRDIDTPDDLRAARAVHEGRSAGA